MELAPPETLFPSLGFALARQSHAVSIDSIEWKDRNMNASKTNASIVYLYQGELRHGKGFHPKTVNDILRHI